MVLHHASRCYSITNAVCNKNLLKKNIRNKSSFYLDSCYISNRGEKNVEIFKILSSAFNETSFTNYNKNRIKNSVGDFGNVYI